MTDEEQKALEQILRWPATKQQQWLYARKEQFAKCADKIQRGVSFDTAVKAVWPSALERKILFAIAKPIFEHMEGFFYQAKADAEEKVARNEPGRWLAKHDRSWVPTQKVDVHSMSDEELQKEAFALGLMNGSASSEP